MKYDDIKTKFLIEYDKANVTSSYPSLTDYEIATILDKAYLAIIAQKLTGNQQRSSFEQDIKAIEDIRPLLKTIELSNSTMDTEVQNRVSFSLSSIEDFLYYIQSKLVVNNGVNSIYNKDSKDIKFLNTILISHEDAKNFFASVTNIPWIKEPRLYIEDNTIYILYDKYQYNAEQSTLILTYIKKPHKFVDLNWDDTFILSDTMAEELINLAIIFALENIESSRLQTKNEIKKFEV